LNNIVDVHDFRLSEKRSASMEESADRINWTRGFDGVAICWFGYAVLFPHSAFWGLTVLGVGSLLVGAALGRD
jgi:hypothetical protein